MSRKELQAGNAFAHTFDHTAGAADAHHHGGGADIQALVFLQRLRDVKEKGA